MKARATLNYKMFWRVRRAEVIQRDGGRCVLCSAQTTLTVHHIRAYCLSRNDSPTNLVTLCERCHGSIERFAQRTAYLVTWLYTALLLRARKARHHG